ncbi:MAG TPA: hypothetical protein VG168_07410, partial [Bryobacteraceae bacterium]|nr:hypothetical protein [Bryobacteraceae bacterium]
MRYFLSLCLCAAAISAVAQTYVSVPPADAPELAARGKFPVGVQTVSLIHRNQVDILHFNKETGKAPLYDRSLMVEIWYPAQIPAGSREETIYWMPVPGGHGFNGSPVFDIRDKALRNAPPIS